MQHGLTTFLSPDVMRFLGREAPPHGNLPMRPPPSRGQAVEDFKTYRAPENRPDAKPSWQRMREGVADLHRRAEVSQAANDRYLQALASVEDTTSLGELAARLCRPVRYKGRRARAINPHAPDDAALLEAISRGEFILNGLRNRDLRALLFNKASASKSERHRQAAAVSRKLLLLRAPSPDPQGTAHAPLPPDESRAHRRHRLDRGAQCQHAGTHQMAA